MKILILNSDIDGCWKYRIDIPFKNLRRLGVESYQYCFLPNNPADPDQNIILMEMFKGFDLIIIQRCYTLHLVSRVCQIAEFLGIPTIFETDDDYASLQPSNPAYFAVARDQSLVRKFFDLQKEKKIDELNELLPILEESRKQGLEDYKKLLPLPDWLTVSTKELKRAVYQYNKNVQVFENNIDQVYPWRDSYPLANCLEATEDQGRFNVKIPNTLELFTIPNHNIIEIPAGENLPPRKAIQRIPRIGYSCTPSHFQEDWHSILPGLNEFCKKNPESYFITLLGDQGAFWNTLEVKNGAFVIPPCQYEKYLINLRNIDIMLCPLHPNIFNQSKSDIKLVEAGAWGIPGLAPRFITYSRNFVDEETCLMYDNKDEFAYQLERLVKDGNLRERLGKNVFEYVRDNRQEKLHSEKRLQFYQNVISGKKRLEIFEPA